MKHVPDYKCRCNSSEEIPEKIAQSVQVTFEEAYSGGEAMAAVADAIRRGKEDIICKVPFCVTVEAEAFGAEVTIPNLCTGPRFQGYAFNRLEDMAQLGRIDVAGGRMKDVLHAVSILAEKGRAVALNVEAPFTILAMLIDSVTLYRGIYKQREQVESALQVISRGVVDYVLAGIASGAKIISYADPSGVAEIVGPKIFRELSGKYTCDILKQVERRLDSAVIHLCGKTSLSLEQAGLCRLSCVELSKSATYGEAICRLANEKKVRLIGHNCLKITAVRMPNPVVWQVDLL